MKKGQNLGKIEVKNTKSPNLKPIFHFEHCKYINGRKKWLCKRNNTKHILWKAGRRGSQACKKGKIWGKNKANKAKSPILRPIFHLKHCKSVNWRKKSLYKQNNSTNRLRKTYVGHRSSQTCEKSTIWIKLRSKIQNRQFCGNLEFVSLLVSIGSSF